MVTSSINIIPIDEKPSNNPEVVKLVRSIFADGAKHILTNLDGMVPDVQEKVLKILKTLSESMSRSFTTAVKNLLDQ